MTWEKRALRLKHKCYEATKVNLCYEDPRSLTSSLTRTRQYREKKHTQRYFSFKHSTCPPLYSKTCKISTFIKGPFFSVYFSSFLIGLTRGSCCNLEQCIFSFFCSHVKIRFSYCFYFYFFAFTSDVCSTRISKTVNCAVL